MFVCACGGGGGEGASTLRPGPSVQLAITVCVREVQGNETVGEPLPLDKFPFFLFGKERKIADIPTDHPSCSRQHAVICFR